MNTHAEKTQKSKSQSVANEVAQKQSGSEFTFQFLDNQSQTKLQEKANQGDQVKQLRAFQEIANKSPQIREAAQLQAMADNYSRQQHPHPIQKKENKTGLPDNLKSGIESLSGYSMDDVKVHRDSDKPAQLNAHAYAQGTDIHLASGQEKHLPHEAWHVVQQKQGRVKPTMRMKGEVKVNDDIQLEKEADVMGEKAVQLKSTFGYALRTSEANNAPIQFTLTKEEYFERALALLKSHESKVVEKEEYLRSEFKKGAFDAAIADKNVLNALKSAASLAVDVSALAVEEAPLEAVADVVSYAGARALATREDLKNADHFTSFGGGVNKQAYGINGSPWVVLCAPASKERLIVAEIDQILRLSAAGIDTPKLGVGDPEAAIFTVLEGGKEKIAFLEEKVDGFEIPRAGTAFSEDEVKAFGLQVAEFISGQDNLMVAKEKRAAALRSIELLKGQLQKEDIPDFQVRLDRNTGRILSLDPGDPLNSENAQEKHLRWLNHWTVVLNDTRYLTRLWNAGHPDNKIAVKAWS